MRRPWSAAPIAVPVVLVTLVLWPAGPAHAHGGEVQLEVIEQTPAPGGASVDYLVALTYVGDGDGIDDATVTATAFLAGAAPSSPVTFTPTGAGGGYRGTVTFGDPGRWTIRFASADPAAAVEAHYRVAPPPPTTVAPTTVPPTTAVPPDDATLVDDDREGDSDPPMGLIVGLAVTGVVLVSGAVVLLRRRRAATP